jgi:ATP-dependent DNA helicase RecG
MEQIGFEFTFTPKRDARLMSADELYDEMSQQIAVDIDENHKIERKSARYGAKELGDYFSMWANSSPNGGVIVVGVENDGRLAGCNAISVDRLNEIQRAGDVYCSEARYACKEVPIKNAQGKADVIIAIRVFYNDTRVVETSAREAFARRGGSKRLLSDAEKRELALSKGQLEIEREPVRLVYPDDFRAPLIAQFVENVRADRGMSTSHSIEDVLELRRLGKINADGFQPNLACALLFAKDPQETVPGCKIRFVRFDGTVEKTGKDRNAVKSFWIEGPVPELILETEKIVSAQLREFMRLGDGGKFVSTAEYPKDAWYEAIVNACVHRSYNLNTMHISIKMFDDRLEVESPGGFPPLVTPENIYDVHVPRNPHLMDAMFYMRFVLCEHEGTRRIRDTMAGLGLPEPTFVETTSTSAFVRVTLKNDVEHRKQFIDSDAFEVLGAALSATLTPIERRIVNYIAEHGTINATEASRLTGVRWHTIKKTLSSLVDRNIVDHVHSATVERDRHAYFTLKKRFVDRLRQRKGNVASHANDSTHEEGR